MRHRKTILFVSWFLMMAVLITPFSLIEAQSNVPRWSKPEQLGEGWFPTITVDQTDTVYVGWHGANPTNELLDLEWFAMRHSGEDFSTPTDVIFTGEGGYTLRSALDVSSEGVIFAMYRARTHHEIAAAPASASNVAKSWQLLKDFDNSAYYLDMMIDQNDVIHTISSEQGINLPTLGMANLSAESIQERVPCAFCSDLIYRRSADRGLNWSSPVNVSNTIGGSERPNIFQGQSGRIYVSWSEGSDWYIHQGEYEDGRFVYSEDGGQNWSEVVKLAGDGSYPVTQFALTEMSSGDLLAVWRYASDQDRHIYFQSSGDLGNTWTTPQPVPYIIADTVAASILDKYELITDLAGVVHLFAIGNDAITLQGPAVYHLEYRQGSWLLPDRIYYDPKIRRPEWPSANVGPRNDLHLTWFVRVGDGKEGTGDVGTLWVYYAERAPTLPDRPVLAAYAPTVTPLPPPTTVATFAPTPTLIPTLAPIDTSTSVKTNRDLYATQTLLGAILAVGILCVGVLVASGFRPRS